MRKILLISTVFFLYASCSQIEKMKYEENITSIYKVKEVTTERLAKNERELPIDCNLYLMNEYKVKTPGLSFLSPEGADNYIYGEKYLFENRLILYSNEYSPQTDESGDDFYEEINWRYQTVTVHRNFT